MMNLTMAERIKAWNDIKKLSTPLGADGFIISRIATQSILALKKNIDSMEYSKFKDQTKSLLDKNEFRRFVEFDQFDEANSCLNNDYNISNDILELIRKNLKLLNEWKFKRSCSYIQDSIIEI
jgi:hypothetical protein